jgi:tetratricopeptide (TPR) repeat protein
MNSTKAWWYRSQVYQFIASEKELHGKYPEAGIEALASFKKMNDLNDPKFKDWEDAVKNLMALSTTIFNDGVDQFQAKKFDLASKSFGLIPDINSIIEARGGKSPIEAKTALDNAAVSAENGGLYKEAVDVYSKLISKFPDVKYYNILYQLHKKNGNLDAANAIVEEGLTKYPSDKDLLISKVNALITSGKSGAAVDYLKKIIEQDPKNEVLYVALGQAYEQLKDETHARETYANLLKLNPNSFDGNYGMGAMIFNKAKDITDQMNALGYGKADQVKYEELKGNRTKIFAEAKPFLDKALTIKPDNASVKAALGNIDSLTK